MRGCVTHSSCKMAEGGRKRYSAEEVIELIFADEDSNDEDIDCASDVDFIPESDNVCIGNMLYVVL